MNFIQEAVSRAREDKDFGTMYLAMAVGELQKQITPPQRTWVGLTDEELADAWPFEFRSHELGNKTIYQAIEAKLKEKNT